MFGSSQPSMTNDPYGNTSELLKFHVHSFLVAALTRGKWLSATSLCQSGDRSAARKPVHPQQRCL
jgi:hypothetical protein